MRSAAAASACPIASGEPAAALARASLARRALAHGGPGTPGRPAPSPSGTGSPAAISRASPRALPPHASGTLGERHEAT